MRGRRAGSVSRTSVVVLTSELERRAMPHEATPQKHAITDVSPPELGVDAASRGDVLTAISDGMVALLKEFYGRGPTQAKSYFQDDLVVCVLRGGFSRVEQTLLHGGRGAAVIQQRMEFQELMRGRFTKVVEGATGRPVIGFMSGNQQHPDLMCEVFILGPSDLVDDDPHLLRTLRINLTASAELADRPSDRASDCACGRAPGRCTGGDRAPSWGAQARSADDRRGTAPDG